MSRRAYDFASLLDPMSLQEFFSAHWERAPLQIRGRDDDYYRDLLTNADLEAIISNSDARFPAIKLAKNGSYFPAETYTKDVTIGDLTFHGVQDLDKISAEYGKGATIALPALHRTWGPLRELCMRLEQQFDCLIHANAYLTPGRARGFTPHYDTHEVLVLQLAGRKRWLIDTPAIQLPHCTQSFDPRGFVPGPRLMELDLAPGDLLYLPRGYVHSTMTSDSHSAHVTVGISPFTWADLAGELVPGAIESQDLRRALPVGFANHTELHAALRLELARIVGPRAVDSDLTARVDWLVRVVKAAKTPPQNRFRSDAIVITADSVLAAPPPEQYRIVQRGDPVQLEFDGRQYAFPALVGPTLDAMCTRPTFRLQELPQGPNADLTFSFASYLQGIGFLRSAPIA